MNEWNFNESLPEEEGKYEVALINGDYDECYFDGETWNVYNESEITAWRYLT